VAELSAEFSGVEPEIEQHPAGGNLDFGPGARSWGIPHRGRAEFPARARPAGYLVLLRCALGAAGAFSSQEQTWSLPHDRGGPGIFFRDHRGLYALCLTGALGTAGYAAAQARKAGPGRALGWWALAGLTAAQAAGMVSARRRAPTSTWQRGS